MMQRHFLGTGLVTFALLGLVGCDSPGLTSKKAKSAADVAKDGDAVGSAETTGAGMVPLEGQGFGAGPMVETQGLAVSGEIAKACGIAPLHQGREVVATKFDFDSTAVSDDDRSLLQQVAKCLTDGPLRGKGVALVGRADPRGEAEYNMTLGESRADSVMRYMVDLGVGRDRLRATSRGEIDATGTDETTWAHDRRVDLELSK